MKGKKIGRPASLLPAQFKDFRINWPLPVLRITVVIANDGHLLANSASILNHLLQGQISRSVEHLRYPAFRDPECLCEFGLLGAILLHLLLNLRHEVDGDSV